MRKAPIFVLLLGLVVVLSPPAHAGCHQFTFDRNMYTVRENARSIMITVSRDAAAAPSSIDYQTVNGTATAGADYRRASGTLVYTTETQMSFRVRLIDDTASEANETFRVRLRDPSGCAPNPNYDVDEPATITIRDNDQAVQPTETPTTTATPSPTATATPSPTQTATVTASPIPTAGDGLSAGVLIAIIAAAIALTVAVFALLRRRA